MNLQVEVSSNRVLPELLRAMGENGRKDLFAVAVNELAEKIAAHIRAYSGSKHGTARAFGAPATGHFTKGAAAISTSASSEGGTVTIPIPGISRAFEDLTITPKRAGALTIPLSSGGSVVYGHTVAELKAMGWKIFRGKGKASDILFGSDDGGETRAMFVLKSVVNQPRDPSLLPSREDMASTAATAMIRYVISVVRAARKSA